MFGTYKDFMLWQHSADSETNEGTWLRLDVRLLMAACWRINALINILELIYLKIMCINIQTCRYALKYA